MSNIQDMNNRIRQNRDQRPSKRAKFKENNRDPIYTASQKEEVPLNIKTVSETELDSIKKSIRKAALKDQKRLWILSALSLVFVLLVLFGLFWLMQ
ncbi:hypothetical protein [Flagellimonas sp.]|uniref:hypothetical protein n=1 Tax=Flagellimonas sp. TaxID=2058762 RepID=UPI003BB1C490